MRKLFILIAAILSMGLSAGAGWAQSNEKAITAFDFAALVPAVTGVVDEGAKTVALTVPFGTDVTELVPTITVSALASVAPLSGVAQDFTAPVVYTVTAEDLSTEAYTVTVTIAPAPSVASISLMTPNGGESWAAGSQQYIVWNAQNVGSGNLEYSMNNGVSWTTIATGINLTYGSYLWTVPAGASSDCKVRISGSGKTDTSFATFTITSTSPVTVTDITIVPAPAAKTAAGSAASGNYLILVDLNTGTAQNVKVITWAKAGTTTLAVQEWYGTRDADNDGDIDTISGSVSDVTVGKFTLSDAGTVSVGVSAIIVGTASYYSTTYQEDVTIVETPSEFNVSGFYPNPFNPVTNIDYSVPEDGPVMLSIYDISGRLITTLVNDYIPAGTYTATWNARDDSGNVVSSGLYLYRMTAGSFSTQGKVMFLK